MDRTNMLELSLSRRQINLGLTTIGFALASGCSTLGTAGGAETALAELERSAGGKLGATILNTRTGQSISHRGGERFGMCSSFKLALAALILRKADGGELDLDSFVPITSSDMVYFAPVVTENLAKGGMTIGAMAEAAQVFSDNVATNKLLAILGGPAGFTAAMRAIGDVQTRLDRLEPEMMLVDVGDPRDTTTPFAMAHTVAKMTTTNWLSVGARTKLLGWMEATKTGSKRIRAGLPADWRSGDKTGTGMAPKHGPDRYNDIAIAWPNGGVNKGAPIIITGYYESPVKSETMRDEDQAVLAELGKISAHIGHGVFSK
ncbi:class A beta-lactamase [Sphingorhabdus sp. IMCC26285]|uniref:beta-lactamase n=1 Tax=Sphingorhabdus profundilacus TaxID=2509718 RepID=A0A6I4M139_9SPHN|nr:class A beta-lactamase [Sphingorhabdus profundilacus]MVZ96138.1 class A beta-lactamase [Sphingorhabdus profundilacus]